MSVSFGFQARSKRTSLEPQTVCTYDYQYDPTLDGNWRVTLRDAAAPKPARGEKDKPLGTYYMSGPQIIGRRFPHGIHTVAQLEEAQVLAGLAPEMVPLVDAYGVQFMFDNQVQDLVDGKSLTAHLVDPKDAETVADLWTESQAFTDERGNRSAPPAAWTQRARAVKIRITIVPTNIEPLIDQDLVELDVQRCEARTKAVAAGK